MFGAVWLRRRTHPRRSNRRVLNPRYAQPPGYGYRPVCLLVPTNDTGICYDTRPGSQKRRRYWRLARVYMRTRYGSMLCHTAARRTRAGSILKKNAWRTQWCVSGAYGGVEAPYEF